MTVKTLGDKIDALQQLREEVRTASDILDTLKEKKAALELVILDLLDKDGIDKASGKLGSVYIKETVVGQIKEPDKLYRYIKKNDAFELLEKRISSVAYREHLEQRKGKPLPGTVSFNRRVLNLRTRNS